LKARRRTVLPRHRTMRAVVDWSYGLLSEDEQKFFRALSVFAGGFTVHAASAVGLDTADPPSRAIDRLADLVAKSLVIADVSSIKPRFRLLDTIRACAIEKLDESGEREQVAHRHAEHYRAVFQQAETEAMTRSTHEWLVEYTGEIDNLRAALDWACSPEGEASIGVALTVAAVPLWLQLSLVEECRSRVQQALTRRAREAPTDARGEMKLQAALSISLFFTQGATFDAGEACSAALRLAQAHGDSEYQLLALWELWVYRNNRGEYAAALTVAQQFYALSLEHSGAADQPVADRMLGTSYHYMGEQTNAQRYIDRMMSLDVDLQRWSPLIRFWFDQKVVGRVVLARILWLRGFADQAWRTMQSAVGDAEALGDPATLCYALSHGGCLVALWVGNFAAAGRYADMLLDHSRKHGFAAWNDFASRLKGVVLVKSGDLDGGSRLLWTGLDEIDGPNAGLWFLTGLGEMAEALCQMGRFADGLATVDRVVDQSYRGWLTPELLRIKGEFLLLQGTTRSTEVVEGVFRQALDAARIQEALSWELRAAASFARLLRSQGRPTEAKAYLRAVYDRFTEGFDTADLVSARQLLDELSHVQ
jgi:predicted ATPase